MESLLVQGLKPGIYAGFGTTKQLAEKVISFV
jgi:hypothetical protein